MKKSTKLISFLMAMIMIISIFQISTYNVEAAESKTEITFSPRFTEPDADNEYYYSDMNLFEKYGYGLPNCTAYAYGRAYEILGTEPKLSRYNADTWYDYNIQNGYYEYGQEPRVGAIACWKNGGHVAVVEQVNSDGTVIISESRYNKENFYLTTMKKDSSDFMKSRTFQGYIYILPEDVTITNPIDDSAGTSDGDSNNGADTSQENGTVPDVDVTYRTHVQNYGWQRWVNNGKMSGTSGESKRLEGINIKVSGNENLGIQYTTHVQTYGWQSWSSDGEMSGTSGQSKRLEAIEIQLTGADKDKYDVYYRVHAQTYGWLNWAKNGEPAGTSGYSKRLEGIEIVVVKKGEEPPVRNDSTQVSAYISTTGNAIYASGSDKPNVLYRTHVQTYGWQEWSANGIMSGTSGQSKRLEGIEIKLTNLPYEGGVSYRTHVQTYGWEEDFVSDGEMSGTSGQSKRLEAIEIKLTGEIAQKYDIYYRVHVQKLGWLGWAKNGEPAGSAGYSYRLEGIEIVLVEKGKAAPGSTVNCFVEK